MTIAEIKKDEKQFQKSELYMMNTLFDILPFHTWSGNEEIMRQYVLDALKELGFTYEVDKSGNIAATRGTSEHYPLLNAHMDIVYSISTAARKTLNEINKTEKKEDKKITSIAIYKGEKENKKCGACVYFESCISAAMKTYDIKERDAYFKLRESRGCEQYIPDEIKYNDYLHSSYDKTYFDKLKNTAKNIATCTSRWFDDDSIYSYGSWYKTDKEKHQEDEMLNEMFKLTYNAKTGKITSSEDRVLGGDDKCGVALALATAFRLKNEPMKILFTVGEEIGCVGIKAFIKEHADWFKDVKYSITIDRRGSDNLLKWSAGKQNCSDKFCAQLALHGVLAGIPVKVESGMLADVVYIRDIVPEAANISAGYYNPHSTTEYIEFEAMCFILEWLRRIILYTKL